MRKHPFTLLEMLIALSLSVVLISFIAFFFYTSQQASYRAKELEKRAFCEAFVEFRLQTLFQKTLNPLEDRFCFFSGSHHELFKENTSNLIFTFDEGVSLNHLFSNILLTRLFVSPQGELTLVFWPYHEGKEANGSLPMHKEILLSEVFHLSFQFFVPKLSSWEPLDLSEKEKKLRRQLRTLPQGQWISTWSSEYALLPAIVMIDIRYMNQEKPYEKKIFVTLPAHIAPIAYK